jgi:hypothetical protein
MLFSSQLHKKPTRKYRDARAPSNTQPSVSDESTLLSLWFKIVFFIVFVSLAISFVLLIYGAASNQNNLTISGLIIFALSLLCLLMLVVVHLKKRRSYSNKNAANIQISYTDERFPDSNKRILRNSVPGVLYNQQTFQTR